MGEHDDETSVWSEYNKLISSQCKVCGKLAKYEFCHYGDINDCLDYNNKIKCNHKENRYIIPKNHTGNIILRSARVHRKQQKSILNKGD